MLVRFATFYVAHAINLICIEVVFIIMWKSYILLFAFESVGVSFLHKVSYFIIFISQTDLPNLNLDGIENDYCNCIISN